MRLLHAVLHQAGQVHGQRAGAHARTGAQQQHAAPLAVGAPAAGDGRVQQALHHVLHFLRRDRGIDEIADPGAQGGDGAFGLAEQAHRDPGNARRDARQQAGQLGRTEQLAGFILAQREVQEHHLRRDLGQALGQVLDGGRFLGQHPQIADGLTQLRGHAIALGTKQEAVPALQAHHSLACVFMSLTVKNPASAARSSDPSGNSPRR